MPGHAALHKTAPSPEALCADTSGGGHGVKTFYYTGDDRGFIAAPSPSDGDRARERIVVDAHPNFRWLLPPLYNTENQGVTHRTPWRTAASVPKTKMVSRLIREREPVPGIRSNVVLGVTKLDPFTAEHLEAVAKVLLNDASESVRAYGVSGLSRLSPEICIELGAVDLYILALTQETSSWVLGRLAKAVSLLGEHGSAAAPILRTLLEDPDLPETLRPTMESALEKVGG